MILRDVDYVVEAMVSVKRDGLDPVKYVEMFRRRVEKGQHFRVPVFGCREFPAEILPAVGCPQPVREDRELGMMPLRTTWKADGPETQYFPAVMRQGVIDVPAEFAA